ncbi:MAG TPA: O-antigen ligase family protein [Verrucomicrobiae bacterium]|jgi:hypothetical protein
MKKLPLYLYLLIAFLIPHIRWISPIYSKQWVYGMPFYAGVALCFMFPLFFQWLPRWRLFGFVATTAVVGYIIFIHNFDIKYAIPGSYMFFLLIGMPIVGLGAPLVLTAMEDPRFARKVLIVLSASCLLQVVFMSIETNHTDLLFLVRPNSEGTQTEWWFANRFGSNRAMYTLTDPMSAGAWAWFTGITLIVLSPLAKVKPWQRSAFVVIGTLTISSIVFTVSRGPAIVSVISLLILIPCMLHTTRRRFLALLSITGTIIVIVLSIILVFFYDRPLFESVTQISSQALGRDEDGNAGRIDVWAEGVKILSDLHWRGAGLHTISFLWEQRDENFEDTYLTIIYATGISGLIYSIILIVVWSIQTCRLGFRLYFTRDRGPQRLLCLAWAAGWLPYTFIFPCFRAIDCAFITCSILGSLYFYETLGNPDAVSTASHSISRRKFVSAET